MPEGFDPNLLTSGPAQVGLTVYLAWVLIKAVCGDDAALRDRVGPALALLVAVLLALCYVASPSYMAYLTVLAGILNGAMSSSVWTFGKSGIKAVMASGDGRSGKGP